ncbi:hypothetical protein GJ496_003979 [Pomphorhynchus laevis]|nr:hypothetical protein GJ496_003979 [Pomphorhynchus laevis]
MKDALSRLNQLYVQPHNKVFARHKLNTQHQQQDESIDKTGISALAMHSSLIRQRLLKHSDLVMTKAFEVDCQLELAQIQARSY